MSFSNGNYYFTADTRTYYLAHSGCTYADLFQNVVLPAFQEWDSNCEYVLNGSYPAIKLPWHDGTVGDTVFPMFWITSNATQAVGTGTASFKFGLYGNQTDLQGNLTYYRRISGGSSSGTASWNLSNAKMLFRVFAEDGAYHFGLYPTSYEDAKINTPYHITELITPSGDFENCAISGGNKVGSSSLTTALNYRLQSESDVKTYTIYPNAVAVGRENVGQVVPIDIGNLRHQGWYVYTQQNTSMKGAWDNDLDLLVSSNYIDKVWYENAFTIDGQSFDVMILGTTTSSGDYGISLCRKHE
jgi:hypothetical protein